MSREQRHLRPRLVDSRDQGRRRRRVALLQAALLSARGRWFPMREAKGARGQILPVPYVELYPKFLLCTSHFPSRTSSWSSRHACAQSADGCADIQCAGSVGQERCPNHVQDYNASRYKYCKEYRKTHTHTNTYIYRPLAQRH